MPKARLDLEKDKFDSEGRVKVSIENVNTTGSDQDVIVKNTSSEPIPVSIINPSDAIDLQVEIQPNITIDDSTPIDVNVTNTSVDVNLTALDGDGDLGVKIQNTNDIDVNVTNASVNTNATIQNANIDVNLTDLDVNNRLPVSVDNQPTVIVDDSTPVDVNVTNTVATNATIQNSNLNVTVQNAFQYVYDMVYDGSQWRFQLSDSNGKAINLDRTYYTSSDITTMGASDDINVWLAAYNDSMLTKKYVASWDAEYEQDVYLQHPSLSSGNCLHLIYQYTTQNAVKVLESVWAKIDTWSYNDEIAGTVSITAGTVTSPASDAAAGTDVCTLTATNNSIGDIVVSLSGTNASLYQLNDGVTTGSSITNPSTPLVIETASTFSGATYSHSVTATITGSTFEVTDSVTIETSSTATVGFSNTKYLSGLGSNTSTYEGVYNEQSNGGFFGSGGSTGLKSSTRTVAFWAYLKNSSSSNYHFLLGDILSNTKFVGIGYNPNSGLLWCNINDYAGGQNEQTNAGTNVATGERDKWHHVAFTFNSTTTVNNISIYLDGVLQSITYNYTSGGFSHTDFSVTKSAIGGSKPYNLTYTPTNTGVEVKIDEIVCFEPALDQTNNEITELFTGSSTGTTGLVFDYTTHSRASDIYRYIRFGDGNNDSESSIYCQASGSTFQLDKTSGITGTYITDLTSSDDPYVPASGTWANDYYARSNTTTSSVVDYRLNGTEKSLWPSLSTGTNTFPPLSSAWTITFWLYMPSSGTALSNSNRECLLKTQVGSAQGGMQVFMRGFNTLECYIAGTTAGNYFYGFIGSGFSFDAWNLVTITYDGNYNLAAYTNVNPSTGSGSNGLLGTINTQLSNATINNTEIMSFVYTPAGGSSVSRSNRFYRMDELTAYNIELNSTQRAEVYNSGTPIDPSTLSFASNVESYFRFGDGSSDSLTNYYAYDDNDNTRYFEPITAGTRDFTAY